MGVGGGIFASEAEDLGAGEALRVYVSSGVGRL